MPSTYSTHLLLELMADGENSGLWGDITNENLEILGRAVSGLTTVSLAGTTHTLTVTQGTASEGHFAILELGGSPTGTNTITINPNTVSRVYLVKNLSGQTAVFTQGSGGNVTIANGNTAIIYCNGAGAAAKVTDLTEDFLRGVNNLSDVDDAAAALVNLGLTATATEINKLDGFTGTADDLNYAKDLRATGVTPAELDKLDGFTGTADDLNYAKDLRATGVTTTEFDKLDGLTATTAELNKLGGFTGSAADLNYAKDLRATGVTTTEFDKLDGLTASTAELNLLDGLTASTAELNLLDGLTATTAELNKLDGFTGSAADLNYAKDLRATGVTTTEFDKLDGLTASTAELNLLDGKTAQDFFPSGGIIMWSGSLASIPSGWALCNGANGTPDLRDRFIVGAGSSYSPGNTGGANSVTLTEAQMPSHTHTGSVSSASLTGSFRLPTNTTAFSSGATGVFTADGFGTGISSNVASGTAPRINLDASHNHTLSINSAGGGGSHENRPPYYALAYIMKL